ncbi:ADP-ribosylglycohydrolase family protein [Rheinheimera baltica]|uniref:ADP-ribosylglycohydrolase family protein n=1 Tax=Rheinheimera baltica TaxID=67576 RepID=A0ABT9I5L7_9GAMM|nr:ADP-ribosylglycohydrolase family protein [Rheinheimera baltica]MDP5138677.1 ADP-ribosylglycohydrolase family protein [Rheinheimera baltica]MDP5148840.1 ADP-ribosylglycohydrolase family protein [Rheinheimera baltica]
MLYEIAIADVYGAGFEFAATEVIAQHNDLSCYVPHQLYGMLGNYTDDTQMSLALAELLVADAEWTALNIADKFVKCFKRDPRQGYSKGFYAVLQQVENGQQLLTTLRAHSTRNGAAMRAVPLGIIASKHQLLTYAKQQAAITHNTPTGIASSCTVALAAHFGLYQLGEISQLPAFLQSEGFADWNYNWQQAVTVEAFDTVSAALSCLLRHDNLADLLQSCVALSGDTDSVAAIAVGIASCFTSYRKNLPEHLKQTLNEPQYGLAYLAELDKQLLAKVSSLASM